MGLTRRQFGTIALATPAAALAQNPFAGPVSPQGRGRGRGRQGEPSRPNSTIDGVRVGTISYSFRSMPERTAEATLDYLVRAGISHVELMSNVVDTYLGLGGRGRRGSRGGRSRDEAAAERRSQRLAVPMSKVEELRQMYDVAGVQIYAVKNLDARMSDEEVDWAFTVGKTLGADHLTLELLEDPVQLERLGGFAVKHGMSVAYHTHTQGSMTVFDEALAASPGNKANVDFGHYVAGGGGDPMPFLERFHDRIASFHLKDRTEPPTRQNLPWGQGDTPIAEILRTVRDNRWDIPATIELEYRVPEWSDAVQEVAKCLAYCRGALA